MIETQRLILSPLTEKDCTPTYLSWLNDAEVNKYLESRFTQNTLESLVQFAKAQQKPNVIFLSIKLKDSLKHIGNIKIDKIHSIHKTAEYGILMGDQTEWGKGYAKEATIALIDYCFKHRDIRKITLGVVVENTAAYELYKKVGFVQEGRMREEFYQEGNFLDIVRMAVFKESWKKEK